MSEPEKIRRCAQCGAELPATPSPELCPKCLLKQALATEANLPADTAVFPAAPRSGAMPPIGPPFGHYQIIRPLGGGGMGTVFEAEDLDNGRRVALKVLSQAMDSPDSRERFFREGRLAASINHPNSVYVFGTEEIAGTPVIAMELVGGGTLEQRVRTQGPMAPAQAVDAVLQIIAGLEAARRVGILHRDVKPSNCFVAEDGAIKIGDFGLSISTALRLEPALTATGAFLGTPAFCSPEQLRGEDLNARSDMYSVGATLFFLLTGRTPFEAKNVLALMAMVFEQPAPSPLQLNPKLPQGLAKVVQRCLEKQPGERFRNYDELARELGPYSSSAPVPAALPLRFIAGAVDSIVLGLIGLTALIAARTDPIGFLNWVGERVSRAQLVAVAAVVAAALYYALLEGLWGATLGKALCRFRVIGPNRNVPGLGRAMVRTLIYVVVPVLATWLMVGFNPKVFLEGGWLKQVANLVFYAALAGLFCTVRRRNGYAALQDLASGTRVVARARVESRPALAVSDSAPTQVETQPRIGPYSVLETIEEFAGGAWLLAYDLRLLRKVWVRKVPAGTAAMSLALRNLARVGRLRWLTGRRSPDENWDAFEAVSGQPLLKLIDQPQSWARVRFWLSDLATELAVAAQDGSLPEALGLDRVWIGNDGRAKLLDFPTPGLEHQWDQEPVFRPDVDGCRQFLAQVASVALAGTAAARPADPAKVPNRLPLHARTFLQRLAAGLAPDAVVTALRPLLNKPAEVTLHRRAALLGGCVVFSMIGAVTFIVMIGLVNRWERRQPGLFQLASLVQERSASKMFNRHGIPDEELSVYIAGHYRSLITNSATWSSPLAFSLIKGEARRFAEQAVAAHPAPSPAELDRVDKVVAPHVQSVELPDLGREPLLVLLVFHAILLLYVGVPAIIAAGLFRGGLLLLVIGVAFVRRDGQRASRLRLFWRSVVTWAPVWLALLVTIIGADQHRHTGAFIVSFVLLVLALVSLRLPHRGLADRLVGTWPVPR